jgi:hypothetical protein
MSQVGDDLRGRNVMKTRRVFLGALGGLLIATGSASAAPDGVPLPDACSASDRALMTAVASDQVEALASGDLDRYAQLSRGVEASLSAACRRALDKLSPARVKCSAEEKQQLLSGMQALMEAVNAGDLMRTLQMAGDLEASVSPSCWIAMNRPQEPALQRGCTSSELDAIAGMVGPTCRATAAFLATGDLEAFLQTVQELQSQVTAALSAKCMSAVMQVQQAQVARQPPPGPPSPSRPSDPPSFVHDHGNGTYSVSGVGYCDRSGCAAF